MTMYITQFLRYFPVSGTYSGNFPVSQTFSKKCTVSGTLFRKFSGTHSGKIREMEQNSVSFGTFFILEMEKNFQTETGTGNPKETLEIGCNLSKSGRYRSRSMVRWRRADGVTKIPRTEIKERYRRYTTYSYKTLLHV